MRISFDFDGTLWDEFDRTPNKQKEEIIKLCKKYIMMLHDVYIITKRWGPQYKNEGLKNEHLIVYQVAEMIGIPKEKVIFTNRIWKADKIKEMNIDLHFENSEMEVKQIEELGIKVVPVEDPYWRDLVY